VNESRLERLAGVAAIAGIVLLFVANIQLGTPPKAEDSARAVARFMADKRSQILVYVALFGVAYILLMTFAAGLRQKLRRAGDRSDLPSLAFGAAVWINAVGLMGVAVLGAAAFRAPALDATTSQALGDIGNVAFALIGAPFAVLFAAASISAMGTRAFPRWVNWVGILAAVVNVAKLLTLFQRTGGLAPNGSLSILFVIPIWVWSVAVGVLMIRSRSPEGISGSGEGIADTN
jgi:hypothetical protein